jgi:hypothetical protein
MIYEYTLVGDGSIYIVDAPAAVEDESFDDPETNAALQATVGHFDYDKKLTFDEIVATELTPGLVSLHPPLVSEAQSVLYGKNQFIFQGFRSLDRFLKVIGCNRRFLRDIEIVSCCHDYADGAASQMAMGLLSEATDLKRLHLGVDAAWPFLVDVEDRARFVLEKDERMTKMSRYLVTAVTRIFRTKQHAHGTTAEDFLNDIFSVHPTSFEFCDHLPCRPFLKWEKEEHYALWEPCMSYAQFQTAAAELRAEMKPLLDAEGRI